MKKRTNPATKPYYKCLSCLLFRNSCAGLPTRDMNQQEWCEYMRDVKEAFHLKNADIAVATGYSVKTVESIMALNYEKDILRATSRRIELFIVGSAVELRCPLVHDDSALRDQLQRLQDQIAAMEKSLAREQEENDRKGKVIDRLLER